MASLDTLLADTTRALADLGNAVTTLKSGLVIVALVNGSTSFVLTPQMIEALETQVNRDLGPHWNVHVRLVTAATPQAAPAGAWYLLITDNADQSGVLGWHDALNGQPYGEVFVIPAQQASVELSTVLSHELLEALVNPFVVGLVQFVDSKGATNLAPTEIGDPVEADSYEITTSDGTKIAVSNFVLPAYFDQTSKGPWDFLGKLSGPIPAMTPGGYLSFLPVTVASGGWQQTGARLAGTQWGRSQLGAAPAVAHSD